MAPLRSRGSLARARSHLLLAFLLGTAATVVVAESCRGTHLQTIVFVDLLKRLPSAERRAVPPIDEAVRVDLAGPASDRRPALILKAPARVIWSMRVPDDARLETALLLVADAGVTARIGISDERIYEMLYRVPLSPPSSGEPVWQPVSIDLGAYAGWQWSLFYKPWKKTWRVVFSADATPGGTIACASPVIVAPPGRR